LQIEINRALYLDEDRIQRKPVFDAIKKRLTETLARLTAIDPALLGGRAFPLAAE
jgi:N-formylglutamate amidohydrolase